MQDREAFKYNFPVIEENKGHKVIQCELNQPVISNYHAINDQCPR